MASEHKLGEVGTEIAPEIADDPEVADRVDVLLRQACHLARSLTGAEQGAIALHATADDAPRKYFSLGPAYAPWRDYRPDPRGLGLHGLELEPGGQHPPMRGWLATAICGGGYRYGLLQLSDKRAEADFSEEDEVGLRELAHLVGAALDALRLSAAAR